MITSNGQQSFTAQTLLCRECGRNFLWSAEEQQHFSELGLKHAPKRCRSCRSRESTQPIPQQEMVRGTVKWFNVSKGYGFITPDDKTKGDIYVHFNGIVGKGFVSLAEGQLVIFQIVKTQKGPSAINVRPVDEGRA